MLQKKSFKLNAFLLICMCGGALSHLNSALAVNGNVQFFLDENVAGGFIQDMEDQSRLYDISTSCVFFDENDNPFPLDGDLPLVNLKSAAKHFQYSNGIITQYFIGGALTQHSQTTISTHYPGYFKCNIIDKKVGETTWSEKIYVQVDECIFHHDIFPASAVILTPEADPQIPGKFQTYTLKRPIHTCVRGF